MTEITVLLVDDQSLLRVGTAMVLGQASGIRVIGEAGNGADAVARARELSPDVVLMDVQMPGMNGIDATPEIIADAPHCRIIILTTFDFEEYAFGALKAGASGFLLKDAAPEDLIGAIRTVADGDAIISPRITQRILELSRGNLPTGGADDAHAALTEREFQVLLSVAGGMSNSEIATTLFLSESTVKIRWPDSCQARSSGSRSCRHLLLPTQPDLTASLLGMPYWVRSYPVPAAMGSPRPWPARTIFDYDTDQLVGEELLARWERKLLKDRIRKRRWGIRESRRELGR